MSFREPMRGPIASCARLDQLVGAQIPVKYPRAPGYRPVVRGESLQRLVLEDRDQGRAAGLLAGKAVAIKDNICVAGVPMMNGSQLLEGYVPEIDATVVTRILEAGGTIAGKAACEDLCFSGASHTCATGPDPQSAQRQAQRRRFLGRQRGGWSRPATCRWRWAATRAARSARRRAGAGSTGLKPTWGLVPTTGSMPISYSVDHCGPMCASTEDVARLLAVIAGHDGLDPRTQLARTDDYLAGARQGGGRAAHRRAETGFRSSRERSRGRPHRAGRPSTRSRRPAPRSRRYRSRCTTRGRISGAASSSKARRR